MSFCRMGQHVGAASSPKPGIYNGVAVTAPFEEITYTPRLPLNKQPIEYI